MVLLLDLCSIFFIINIVSSKSITEDPDVASRIAYGKQADILNHPYMANIKLQESSDCSYCTGSLIQLNWVLTAAHCICKNQSKEVRELSELVIKVGTADCRGYGLTEKPLRLIPHENYSPEKVVDDIGLINTRYFNIYYLYVFKTLPLDVGTAMLAKEGEVIPYEESGKVCGWGLNELNKTQNFLQCGSALVQAHEPCMKYYDPSIVVPNYVICVGQSSTTCEGDSGAPLLRGDKIYGIYIRGWHCTKYPTMFLLVGPYRNWIDGKIN